MFQPGWKRWEEVGSYSTLFTACFHPAGVTCVQDYSWLERIFGGDGFLGPHTSHLADGACGCPTSLLRHGHPLRAGWALCLVVVHCIFFYSFQPFRLFHFEWKIKPWASHEDKAGNVTISFSLNLLNICFIIWQPERAWKMVREVMQISWPTKDSSLLQMGNLWC